MRIEAERLEVTDSRAGDRETPKKAWERLRQMGGVSQQGGAKRSSRHMLHGSKSMRARCKVDNCIPVGHSLEDVFNKIMELYAAGLGGQSIIWHPI